MRLHMAWGIPVGTCLLRSSLTAPLPLFLIPNYKQGMFVSGSSQVAMALGACLAVKSGLLSAFVIDVSGSEVTERSNMNMERVELSDGRWALTTSADKINWKQLPVGAWTEHLIYFPVFESFSVLFIYLFYMFSIFTLSHLCRVRSFWEMEGNSGVGQLCTLSTRADLTSLLNDWTLTEGWMHRTWWQFSFRKQEDCLIHINFEATQEKIDTVFFFFKVFSRQACFCIHYWRLQS